MIMLQKFAMEALDRLILIERTWKTINQLTKDQEKYICDSYYTKTALQLSEEIGCKYNKVRYIWSKNSCTGKKRTNFDREYDFNQNYFEIIDSIDKAYFLGFIAADGCLFDNKIETQQNILRIGINKKDIYILENFKKYINSDKTISITRENEFATLSFTSNKLFDDINKLGLHPNKTYGSSVVNLDDKYMRHFIRGYFEGDGTISMRRTEPLNIDVAIYGFEKNMKQIIEYLERYNIYTKFTPDKRKVCNEIFGRILFTTKNNRYAFLRFIYDGCEDLYLKRKYELSKAFINLIETNNKISNKQIITYYNYAVKNLLNKDIKL